MHPRSAVLARVFLVGSLVAVAVLAGCGGSDVQPTTKGSLAVNVGFAPASAAALGQLESAFGASDSLISVATAATPAGQIPQNSDGTPAVRPLGHWVSFTASATGDEARVLANWESLVLLGEIWRSNLTGTLDGGTVTFSTPEAGSTDGTSYLFMTDAKSYLFTDAAGNPSPLKVDHASWETALRAEAKAMGLTIDSVDWIALGGDAVIVRATATDPAAFVTTYQDTYGSLLGDPGLLEGTFLVVHDPAGGLVKVAAYATGVQTGLGGVAAAYTKYLKN